MLKPKGEQNFLGPLNNGSGTHFSVIPKTIFCLGTPKTNVIPTNTDKKYDRDPTRETKHASKPTAAHAKVQI